MSSVPSNNVSANGIGAILDAQLNTMVQTDQTVMQLRGFIGVTGMAVMLQGIMAPGDGGAGLFYWNVGSYTDDGKSVIVPPGAAGQGAWLRASSFYAVTGFPSVKDFGATGNGVTDDTAAIQAGLTWVGAAGGGWLLFPPGTYKISSTLNVPNGVSLIGECGSGAFPEVDSIATSKIIWNGASGGTMVSIAVLGWGGRMDGIVLDGNSSLAGVCLNTNSIEGGVFNKLTCQFATTGLLMNATLGQNSALNTFYSCFFHDCTNAVILSGDNGTNGTVTLNSFFGCRISGLTVSLTLQQWADTNFFYGGRIEVGYNNNSYGISINPATFQTGVNAITFMGVSIDGDSGLGAAVIAAEPWSGEAYDPIATFYSCYFVGGAGFNNGNGVVKCVECTNLGSYYGTEGQRQIAQNITVGTSPFAYTNPGPFALEMIVGGGTITLLQTTRGTETVTLGFGQSFTITIQPLDVLTMTYTGAAPTVVAQPI